jgi:putative ABC transport system permease protein
MRPLNALRLYRARLRAIWVQECLAGLGIAAGVALLFATQVSSTSLQSSVTRLSRGIAGDATLQLLARSPLGMPESMLGRVRAIEGVRVAAPVLEAGANAIGPGGRLAAVQLIGADGNLSRLGGALVRLSGLRPFAGIGAVALPAPLARAIGVSRFGQEVHFQLLGRAGELPLYSELHERQVGPLAASPLAIVPLSSAQELTGLTGRLSRILVEPARGTGRAVRAALLRLAAGRLNVEPIDYEATLFAKAATVSNQSSALFAAVSTLVGFLFAFNAMLLTVPQRRRLVIDLRRDGYTPRTAIGVLALDAVLLGALACALGLLLGDQLSIRLLRPDTAFFSLAFAVGSQHAISVQSVAIAVSAGMAAALVAVISPMRSILGRDLRGVIAPDAAGGAIRGDRWLALAGALCAGVATLILLRAPDAAIPGMTLLVLAVLLVLPAVLGGALALLRRAARVRVGTVVHLAVMELGTPGARTVAIAATGAIATFGSVAIQGAHGDLLQGLGATARTIDSSSEIWVTPAGSSDVLATVPFAPTAERALGRLRGVAAVRPYRGGLLDYGNRRLLVIAPPAQTLGPVLEAQIVRGDPRRASELVRAGGWLVLSAAVAAEHGLHVGQSLTLPTPDPTPMRIAALSTNAGWAPGAILMSAADYARAWGSQDLSAYDVELAPGASPAAAMRELRRALGPSSGLAVQSAKARIAADGALNREALTRLSQIALLIPIAAVLAMAAAMAAMIWQRRPHLARLRIEGLSRAALWQTTLLESALLVGIGCLVGAAFGVYGQQLADRALVRTINFPIAHTISIASASASFATMTAVALVILAIPGYLAVRVPAALALRD